MIDWIEIADGCEMPAYGDEVMASDGRCWYKAYFLSNGYWSAGSAINPCRVFPKYWANVSLPDGN